MEKSSYSHYRILLNVAPWVIAIVAVALLVLRPDASAQRQAGFEVR